ncbi:hypothetical protein FOZ60_008995 [Perkinsus olseni]|uniref:Uncharacterized protein n=1 Tax=Perkinsus olseni TaxID=32597 RepID=A0A7J6NID4_PEROL|nr:hypothetical protein FOZ60_008995 [Perkinsus olseni]
MVNFLSSILIVQPLLVTAQYVGRYVYETEDFRMIFDVNDDHEADFTFKAHPRLGVTPEGSTSFSTGMVPLENFSDSGYLFALGKRGPGYATFTNLYNAIGHYLSKAGIIQPDDSFPPAGIQHGDLTLLTYTDSDHISTDFQGEEVIFRKAGILIPGTFVYNEPTSPSLKVVFKVCPDGIVRIKVKCGRHSTPRFRCKLTSGSREEIFVVGPAYLPLLETSGWLADATFVFSKVFIAQLGVWLLDVV